MVAKRETISPNGISVDIMRKGNSEDFISLTDIAKFQNPDAPADIIKNWMRSRNTIEYLGLWEQMNNPEFKLVEFDQFKNEAGLNTFVLSPKKWIDTTNAVGLISQPGRYGGTYAHSDIAFEFASWVSPEFKLYLIKDYQKLKQEEASTQSLEWTANRLLAKVNYRIHTDAIKENLIRAELTKQQIGYTYASEGDLLNVALFGKTAAEWKRENAGTGNLRENASIEQLIVLSNLESMNAELIKDGIPQKDRLVRLNTIARSQLQSLINSKSVEAMRQLREPKK